MAMLRSGVLFVLAASFLQLVLSGCSSTPKVATPFSSGYDKITIARGDGPAENETIKPEFVSEIRKTAEVWTAIEVYYPKNGQTGPLADQVVSGFRRMSGQVPGLVSFNILKGAGGRVLNYAQFEHKDAYQAWKASATYKQHHDAVRSFAQKVEIDTFDVIYIQQ
ncbi:MAG: antibiotic biosynthesis monooxygenase [Bdellovibrionaceae bacterium]|nr:antibiotic biosynthesis monooxygenase [Pseudobdellovibrionaceae bacterium]